jgi:predicted metal-dependent phosphoesterase TrpH
MNNGQERYDLHCHTNCSDGSMSPEELLQLAKDTGLNGLAITDHDTAAAYSKALPLAEKLGLKMVSGIEFSTVHQNISVHILGYSFKLDSPNILALCNRHQTRRVNRYKTMLELLKKHNMPITEEELLGLGQQGSIGRPHIAICMINKGYVKTMKEAFQNYLAEGKPCYVRTETITVEETIAAIQQANGYAVIAHPHLIWKRNIVDDLLAMKFDGIEVYYSRFPREHEKQWADIAKKKGWLMTGGSDFHGSVKPDIPLGCSWVNEDTFQILHERFIS